MRAVTYSPDDREQPGMADDSNYVCAHRIRGRGEWRQCVYCHVRFPGTKSTGRPQLTDRAMPADFRTRETADVEGPTELPRQLGVDHMARERNIHCPKYAACLTVASRWQGFSCVPCRLYRIGEVERADGAQRLDESVVTW